MRVRRAGSEASLLRRRFAGTRRNRYSERNLNNKFTLHVIEVQRVSAEGSWSRRPMAARADLQRALKEFTEPSLFRGTALAVADLAQYAAAIAGVLWLSPIWAKVACSVFAGLKIANLATLGHDAAHGSLT